MDIRSKTFAVLALVFLCTMGVVYFSAENLLFKGFESVEITDMQVNTYRVYSVLSIKYSALEVMTGDRATSDAACDFLENRNDSYIKENLPDNVFETNKINLILFYNSSGSLFWGKAYDYKRYEETPIPDSLIYMNANDPLIKLDAKSSNTGILVTSSGPMYISSKPVLTTNGEGPSRGTLIIGRFIDAEERGDISWITGLPVSIYALWDKALPEDYKDAWGHISDENPVYVNLTGNASLQGYGVIKDVYGKAAMIFRTESPRTVYPVGRATTRDLLVLFLLSSVFSWLVMLFFFDRTVLFRLSKIIGGVMNIGESGNLETKISDNGKDELNDLAGAINTMLSRINDSEKALRTSEEKYHSLVDNINDVVYTLDRKGYFIYISPAVERLFGYKSEQIIGNHFSRYIHEEDLQDLQISFEKVLEGKLEPYEFRILDSTGSIRFIRSSSRAIMEKDIVTGISGILTDITERRKAEDSLKQSEEEYRNLVDNINDVIYTIDEKGYFTYVSPVVKRALKYEPGEVIGKKFSDIVHPLDLQGMSDYLQRTLSGEFEPYEFRAIDGSGATRYLRSSGKTIFEAGTVRGITGVFTDITARRKAEEKLKEYSQNLERMVAERTKDLEEEKNRVQELLNFKTQFMNQLSHDLRTPLTPMMALMPLLEPHISDARDKERFRVIKNNIEYMRNLVVSILDIARMDAGRFTLNKTNINLYRMVENIISDTKVVFEKSKISSINMIPNNIEVYADELHIKEVFENLISNSVRYSPSGGTITLTAEDRGDSTEISVTDTGIGMDRSQISKLFTEFFKADSSRHGPYSTGLGLSICKRIVEKHGGSISASSEGINRGMTITFTLPKESAEEKK